MLPVYAEMKYFYGANKIDVAGIWLATILLLLVACGCIYGTIVNYEELADTPLLFCLTLIIPLVCLAFLGMFHRKYQLTEDGIVEMSFFIRKITPWSDVVYWGVFPDEGSRRGWTPFICLIKTTEIPYHLGVTSMLPRKKVIAFNYSESRYSETKAYTEKYRIEQLTKDGKGKKYGALL